MTQQGRRPARFSRPRTPHPPKRRTGPSRPPVDDPARQAALDTLREVRARDAYANLLLPQMLRERRITGRDAALATELAYGACRCIGLLDQVLDACIERPLSKVEPALLDVLRLGCYQLLRTRIPPHAAVDVHGGPGARRAGLAGQRVRQRGAAQGVRARRGGVGGRARAGPGHGPDRQPRHARGAPAVGGAGVRRRARHHRRRAGGRAGRRQRAAGRAPGGPARRDHRRGAGRHDRRRGRAVLALRRAARGGRRRPGRAGAGARAARVRAGRGQPAVRARADPAGGRGHRRAVAGPVRRARRQVRAARRGARHLRRPAGRRGEGAAPGAAGRAVHRGPAGHRARRRRPRARRAGLRARRVRPGARGRAVHRARVAAPPARRRAGGASPPTSAS